MIIKFQHQSCSCTFFGSDFLAGESRLDFPAARLQNALRSISDNEQYVIASFTTPVSDLLASYFNEMSLMLMATLLVVYGDIINKQVKRSLSGLHFILRSGLFVLLCAFGYGALTLYGAPLLHHIFKFVAYEYRGVAFIVAFVALGVAAERRRYI